MASELQKKDDGKIIPIGKEKIIEYLENLGMLQKLTNGEKSTFIEICQAFGLNPFKREIYASKYGDNFSIVVGFEVYLKRAERSGLLDGWEVTSNGSVKENNLKAIITIYRKDRSKPFVHEVYYEEYVQKTKDGYPNKFWREKPITMIKKVVMSQGFRLCFSDELGGMPYTPEEISNESTYEVVTSSTPVNIEAEINDAISKLSFCNNREDISLIRETLPDFVLNNEQFKAAGNAKWRELAPAQPKQEPQQTA